MMRDIYRRASRTLIWLAHPSDAKDAGAARFFIMSLLLPFRGWELPEEYIHQLNLTLLGTPALSDLLSKEFFERLWVVQEIVLAESVHIVYGHITVDWKSLAQTVEAILLAGFVFLAVEGRAVDGNQQASQQYQPYSSNSGKAWLLCSVKPQSHHKWLGMPLQDKVTSRQDIWDSWNVPQP